MNFFQRITSITGSILLSVCAQTGYTQVGINANGATPHPSAMLEVSSNNKGVLLPRMTTAERKAIANPAEGLLVFDTDKTTLYIFEGTTWLPLAATSPANLPPLTRTVSDVAEQDRCGYRVAISDDYAIIGAYTDDIDAKANQGSAYIFKRTGGSWIQLAKLTAADGAAHDYFGCSVAISGDWAIVGAYGSDPGNVSAQGSAYIFHRIDDTWTQHSKITAVDGAANDNFGVSVSIEGDVAVIGAPNDDVGSITDEGSAYVFGYLSSSNTWVQQDKITSPDGASGDAFGYSVAQWNTFIAVGASSADVSGQVNRGSVYAYERMGFDWIFREKIIASDGASADGFGSSIAMSTDYIVVGASGHDTGGKSNQGSAYVYARSGATWTQRAILTAADGEANDYFGYYVATAGNYAVVGSFGDDIGLFTDQGSCYLFKAAGPIWNPVRKIELVNAQTNDYTGFSVGMSSSWIIIGSPGDTFGYGRISFLNIEE
ncbi:MAG TPA: hypothetical protein DCF33_22070 [Saprospirales bacterium]|nr:hypothetical protein [Saprospirales bacterium]